MDEEIEKEVEEEERPGGLPIKWIIIGVVILVVAVGGYLGWHAIQEGSEGAASGESGIANKKTKSGTAAEIGSMFPMDPFIVNLNDSLGKRYLKSKIEIEYLDEEVKMELTARLPQLRDLILLQLSSKTMEEIQSIDGKIELRTSLITRINQVLKKGKIRTIYFTQFVIQ